MKWKKAFRLLSEKMDVLRDELNALKKESELQQQQGKELEKKISKKSKNRNRKMTGLLVILLIFIVFVFFSNKIELGIGTVIASVIAPFISRLTKGII